MRLVARRRGCPFAVTEAMLDILLVNGGKGARACLDTSDDDRPTAGQIMGSEPDTMARAAVMVHQHGFATVDLNFACPVKKIKNKARGGHMLRDVPRGVSILRAVRDAVPDAALTVSLRRSFDDSAESEAMFHQIVEAAIAVGVVGIRVHARTVEQKYAGRALWPAIAETKRRYPNLFLWGSGDVFTAHDAIRMLAETGCDGVWIARGAIGNPWIFTHARQLLTVLGEPARRQVGESTQTDLPPLPVGVGWGVGGTPDHSGARRGTLPLPPGQGRGEGEPANASDRTREGGAARSTSPLTLLSQGERGPALTPPTIAEQRDALEEHFTLAMQVHGEQLAGRRMRKMGIKYARWHPQAADVKKAFIDVSSLREWNAVLDRFYAEPGPGVWPADDAVDEVNSDPAMQSCEAPA
jgi:tRNA-dihydrouridine synthase